MPDSVPVRVKPAGKTRSITEADPVLAIFVEDWSWGSQVNRLIVAIWGDGKAVWSENVFSGGSPFRSAQINPNKLTKLLARMERDGYFDKKRSQSQIGFDSVFTSMSTVSGCVVPTEPTWR